MQSINASVIQVVSEAQRTFLLANMKYYNAMISGVLMAGGNMALERREQNEL